MADYERALEAYLQEDFIQAATRFDRFIAQSPDHSALPRAIYYSALCRLNLDQPRPAIERLQSLLSVTDNPPKLPEASALSGEGGSADSNEVPSPAMIRLALGVAHRMIGDETSALSYFESSWLIAANSFERAAAREKIRPPKLPEGRRPLSGEGGPQLRDLSQTADLPPPRRPTPGKWVVQVASTPDRAQADAIRANLQRDGWPVYEESATVQGVAYLRLRVGPYLTESDASSARARLQAKFGLDGWVTRK